MTSLRLTETLEINVKVKVLKTGKTYYRSMKYAKRVTKGYGYVDNFIRGVDGKWHKVNKSQYKAMTNKAKIKQVTQMLEDSLRMRVEREMSA